MNTIRFTHPVHVRRPFGTHRFDVYGRKVKRSLTLFGQNAFNFWVRLETDARVVTYCERPLSVPETSPPRIVDFWTCSKDGEHLYLVLRFHEKANADASEHRYPAFARWCAAHSMSVSYISPEEFDDSGVLRKNWLLMLGYLTASASVDSKPLRADVLRASRTGATLYELERNFDRLDPTPVRTAVFR
jgi:hypothetical protein